MTLPPLQSVEFSNNNVADLLVGFVLIVVAILCSTVDVLELGCTVDTDAGGMAFECEAAMCEDVFDEADADDAEEALTPHDAVRFSFAQLKRKLQLGFFTFPSLLHPLQHFGACDFFFF